MQNLKGYVMEAFIISNLPKVTLDIGTLDRHRPGWNFGRDLSFAKAVILPQKTPGQKNYSNSRHDHRGQNMRNVVLSKISSDFHRHIISKTRSIDSLIC